MSEEKATANEVLEAIGFVFKHFDILGFPSKYEMMELRENGKEE